MPIPNINLIPPAYYLNKQVKVAKILASTAVVLVLAGISALAVVQTQQNTQLKQDKDVWTQKANAVQAKNSEADTVRSTFADIQKKTSFVDEVFKDNQQWPSLFTNIRDYSYPNVRYTSMTPTPGSNAMTLRVNIPDQPARGLPDIVVLHLFWENLLRSPKVVAAAPNSLPGYQTAGGDATNSGLPMPGGGGPGGPPMGPGGPPMPSSMPGGGYMPGGPGGPPAAGRWIGSPSQIAGPAVNALGGQQYDLTQIAGGGLGSLPQEALQRFGIVPPQPPRTVPYEFAVELAQPINVPTYGNATAQQQQNPQL